MATRNWWKRPLAVLAVAILAAQSLLAFDASEAEAAVISPPTTIPSPMPPSPSFGTPGDPRFDYYPAPFAAPGADAAREPMIGIDWKTGNVLYKAGIHTVRVVFDDSVTPPAVQWVDATPPMAMEQNPTPDETDPFIHTDYTTGRTWSGSGVTPCPSMSYSDDDGQHWYTSTVTCPTLGFDNPTVASGPHVPGASPGGNVFPRAVWMCGNVNLSNPGAPGFNRVPGCAVSYDGGQTFDATLPPSLAVNTATGVACQGNTGQVAVDPLRGWVALPSTRCRITPAPTTPPLQTPGFMYSRFSGQDSAPWRYVNAPCAGTIVLCGTGPFPPSISFSRPSPDGNSTGGVLYFAHAEEQGLFVAKALWNATASTWDWQAQGGDMATSGAGGAPWSPPGCGPVAGAGTSYFNLSQIAFNGPGCSTVRSARMATVLAGDDKRAAVAFLGSQTGGSPPPDSCGVVSDVHVWHLYLAMTVNGGDNWTVKRLSNHPVQIGGIWDQAYFRYIDQTRPTAPVFPLVPPCGNLGESIDMDMDAQGRLHIAFADGCVPWVVSYRPACNLGSPGTASNSSWAAVMRQTTGCGLMGFYDEPARYSCEQWMRGGWNDVPQPDRDPAALPYGEVTILNPPLAPATYKHTDSIVARGTVQRDWIYPPLTISPSPDDGIDMGITSAATVEVGRQVGIVINIDGGSAFQDGLIHSKYACHWASDVKILITDDLLCTGTGIIPQALGTYTLTFWAFDKYDPNRRITKSMTLKVVPDSRVECAVKTAEVLDPHYDVAPYHYLAANPHLESAHVDIRHACVLESWPGEDGSFDVVVGLSDLAPLNVAGGIKKDERYAWYGAYFCVDNNPPKVCYGATSETDNTGARTFYGGVIRSGADVTNPALMRLQGQLCVMPNLLHPHSGLLAGSQVDVDRDIVRFRFDRNQFLVTAPPAGCGAIPVGGSKLVEGTMLTDLRAGTALRPQGTTVLSDFTRPETGPSERFRFEMKALPPTLVNAKGVYITKVDVPVPISPDIMPTLSPYSCKWVVPDRTWAENVYITAKKDPSFPAPSKTKECGGILVSYSAPGIYQLNFTLTDARKTWVDHVIVVVEDPNFVWKENVKLYYDDRQLLPPGALAVDTRYQISDTFEAVLDFNWLAEQNPRYAMPGTHLLTAEWTDHNRTVVDRHTVSFIVIWPNALASPKPQFPGPDDVMEGVDELIAELETDGDGIPDRLDNCPGLANTGADRDQDGIGDECDDDIDGDGVPNLVDNCKFHPNPDQRDTDLDGFGDACSRDEDGDGVAGSDNCPFVPNPDQADLDNDGFGDLCDADIDGDSVANLIDVFPYDRLEWADLDGDGIGDNSDPDIDNDGFSNADELAAGTDSRDPNSYPRTALERNELKPAEAAKVKTSWGLIGAVLAIVLVVAVLLVVMVSLPKKK